MLGEHMDVSATRTSGAKIKCREKDGRGAGVLGRCLGSYKCQNPGHEEAKEDSRRYQDNVTAAGLRLWSQKGPRPRLALG